MVPAKGPDFRTWCAGEAPWGASLPAHGALCLKWGHFFFQHPNGGHHGTDGVRASRTLGCACCRRCSRLPHPGGPPSRPWRVCVPHRAALGPHMVCESSTLGGLPPAHGVHASRTEGHCVRTLGPPTARWPVCPTPMGPLKLFPNKIFTRHGTRPRGHGRRLNGKRCASGKDRSSSKFSQVLDSYIHRRTPEHDRVKGEVGKIGGGGGGTNRSDKGLNLSGSWQQGHSATYNTPSRI